MTSKHTFCRICEPTCPLIAEVDDQGEITALKPDRDHPVSKGYACHKGLNYLDVHKDPDRLNVPIRRTNGRDEIAGQFSETSWDHALGDIGQRLRAIRDTHGPDAIGIYWGNPVAFDSISLIPAATLCHRIGSTRDFNCGTQDTTNKFAATAAVFGSLHISMPDFTHTDYLLSLGSNPKVSHWTGVSTPRPLNLVQDIIVRGGKVRYVNPRRIETAGPKTGEVTLIRPDTDVYLLAALLNELFLGDRLDRAVIETYGKNLDGLRDFVAGYPADRVAPVTGIPAETIRQIATEFADAPCAAIYMATGVNQGRQGTLAYWLLNMISFVTGNLGRTGGNFLQNGMKAMFRPVTLGDPAVASPIGKLRSEFGLPGTALADLIDSDDKPIKALIVIAGNPLLSMVGEERMRKAMAGLDLIVSVDIYRNATAEAADYVLPSTDWLERPDVNFLPSGTQIDPYVQYTQAIVPPKGERKPDWWIIGRLEQELGLPSVLDDPDFNPEAAIDDKIEGLGFGRDELLASPSQSITLPQADRGGFFAKAIYHADGKIDCCPAVFQDAFERCADIFAALEQEKPGTMKLISLRTNYMVNSNLANMRALKREKHAINPLHISPADAERLGLEEGSVARVSNDYGTVETPVTIDDTLMDGVVALSHGYGHRRTYGMSLAHGAPGVNVNRLAPSGAGSFDPLSNMAQLTGIAVRVDPVPG